MAELRFSVDYQDSAVREALDTILREAGPAGVRRVLADIMEHLRLSTEERFDRETDPDGAPWAPLHPQTRAQKKHPKILTESGQLRDSIAWEVSDTEGRLGTNKVYGPIHQFGGKTAPHAIRPKRKKALSWPGAAHPVAGVLHPGSDIPARPFLGVSNDDRQAITEILTDHLFGDV